MLFYLAEISELFFNICQELKLRRPVAVTITQKDTKESGWAVPFTSQKKGAERQERGHGQHGPGLCTRVCALTRTDTHTQARSAAFP